MLTAVRYIAYLDNGVEGTQYCNSMATLNTSLFLTVTSTPKTMKEGHLVAFPLQLRFRAFGMFFTSRVPIAFDMLSCSTEVCFRPLRHSAPDDRLQLMAQGLVLLV